MGAVAVFFADKDLAVAGIEVPAVNIVHVTVSVVVNSITRNFSGIRPHGARKLLMVIIDACVDDGYNHGPFVFRLVIEIPSRADIDIDTRYRIGNRGLEVAGTKARKAETAFAAGIDIVSGLELCFYLDELKFSVIF